MSTIYNKCHYNIFAFFLNVRIILNVILKPIVVERRRQYNREYYARKKQKTINIQSLNGEGNSQSILLDTNITPSDTTQTQIERVERVTLGRLENIPMMAMRSTSTEAISETSTSMYLLKLYVSLVLTNMFTLKWISCRR